MTHYLIKSINAIVSDAEINEGDKILVNAPTYNNSICEYRNSPCPPPFVSNKKISKKIEYSNNPLEGLKPFELVDEVEELAEKYIKDTPSQYDNHDLNSACDWGKEQGFIAGYKAKAGFKESQMLDFVDWTYRNNYSRSHKGFYNGKKFHPDWKQPKELLTLYLQEQENRPIEVIQISDSVFKIKKIVG